MRMISPYYDDHIDNKASHCAAQIANYYYKHNEHKGTQFVFSDLGTFKPGEWNVYSEIKRKLVEDYKIPEHEVQFIQQHKSETQRKKVIAAMNEGRVRVIFGSTDMLGTGVNAQQRAVAVHHLDSPWRPSDLAQRDGRAIRKGNEIAKLYADNKVDIIIYAVEKSLDSYKFNLLHNKQMFISQLKSGAMGARTIDEGGSDEKSGMNFSEYMAILSGNTDLLDKAKLDKKVVALESERKVFNKNRHNSKYQLQHLEGLLSSHQNNLTKMETDMKLFSERVQFDKDGNRLNPVTLIGVEGSDAKNIGKKLSEINDRMRTNAGEYRKIGSLYGFNIVVKTESSAKDIFDLTQNKFMIEGLSEGNNGVSVKYSYNNGNIAADPKLATLNFINAMDRIPKLIEGEQAKIAKIKQDIPVLKGVIASEWKKEDELKALKGEAATLERKIALSLKPVEQGDNTQEQEQGQENEQGQTISPSVSINPEPQQRGVRM